MRKRDLLVYVLKFFGDPIFYIYSFMKKNVFYVVWAIASFLVFTGYAAPKGPSYKDLVIQYVELNKHAKEFEMFDVSQEDLEKSFFTYFTKIERQTGHGISNLEKRSMSSKWSEEYIKKKKDNQVFNIVRSAFKKNIKQEDLQSVVEVLQTELGKTAIKSRDLAQKFRLGNCCSPIGKLMKEGMSLDEAVTAAADIPMAPSSDSYKEKFEKYYEIANEKSYVEVIVTHYADYMFENFEYKEIQSVMGKNMEKMLPYLRRNDKTVLHNNFVRFVSEEQLDFLIELTQKPGTAGLQKTTQILSEKADFHHELFWEKISEYIWDKLVKKYLRENSEKYLRENTDSEF